MVKTPICSFCAKTGTLCAQCRKKLRKGKINTLDIDVSKHLLNMENEFPNVRDIDFQKAIPVQDYLALLVNEKSLIQFNDAVLTELKQLLRKDIIPVVRENTPRKTIYSLFSSLEITGIDRIYIPDGTQVLQVRLRGDIENLPAPIEVMREVAKYLIKTDILITIEAEEKAHLVAE
ncbi:MAG: hypothetical protein ACFFCZ_02135 [Promethearchaeota archaeon]